MYDLRLIKVFCATQREKTVKGPLLFQLANDEDKRVREKFQRARQQHHSIQDHMRKLHAATTLTAHSEGHLSEHASLEHLTMIKKHHALDKDVIEKLRDSSAHAPLRCEKSDHDVHGRANRELNATAAVQALVTGSSSPTSSLMGSLMGSPSRPGSAKNSPMAKMQFGSPNDSFDSVNGSQTMLKKKLTGVKLAAGFEQPPTETLEMFAAVPHGSRGPRPMPLSMLHKVISKIYEEKIQADEVADEQGRVRQSLPTFMVAYFQDKYGLKALAATHIGQLVAAVRKHAKPITAFVPSKSSRKDEDEEEEEHEVPDPRVSVFGHISGISLEATRKFVAEDGEDDKAGMAYSYTACNVNFIMDLLSRLITDHENIDETLNDPDVEDRSLTIPRIEKAITRIYKMRRQPVPEYLQQVLKERSFLDKPGRLLPELCAEQGEAGTGNAEEAKVRMLDVDHVLDISLQLWLETMEEGDELLRETFIKFVSSRAVCRCFVICGSVFTDCLWLQDENEDGKLSFDEFTAIVRTVEGERRVAKTGRSDKEVLQMYQQALQESGGRSNGVITMEGFLTVAGYYNLGVPFVDPKTRHDTELDEAVGGADGLVAEDQEREEDAQEDMLDDMGRLMTEGLGSGGEGKAEASVDDSDDDDKEETIHRRDFLADAKKLRDTKEQRERVKRRLGLGPKQSSRSVTFTESSKSVVSADKSHSFNRHGHVSLNTGEAHHDGSQGRLVRNGSTYTTQ